MGRSGVYMVIDSMIERIKDAKTVDVFNFLNHIRTQRTALVQEEVRQNLFLPARDGSSMIWWGGGGGGALPAPMTIVLVLELYISLRHVCHLCFKLQD